MRVCVVGTGYVGLVTGVCLARIGHDVICVDNDPQKVSLLQSGQVPIYEPGLTELMQTAVAADLLHFSTDLAVGVQYSEVIFIAVGTPSLPNGESDTRAVEAVAKGIGQNLGHDYKVIVNKSTVPIGSGDWVKMLIMDGVSQPAKQLVAAGSGDTTPQIEPNFDVVSNPEFLREGSAIYDTLNPDRIVLGGDSETAIEIMRQLYAPIVDRQFAEDRSLPPVPILVTQLSSGEMIKYAANAFLATKISFINEIANICERVGADVSQVAAGIGLDSRIGNKFLQAGIGWGGSCFPKDVAALIHTAQDYGYEPQLLKATTSVNEKQHFVAIEKLQQTLKIIKGKTIGILGLTFKPNTDDLRDAPAQKVIEHLVRLGAKVKAYDPAIKTHPGGKFAPELILTGDIETLVTGCDALVLVTEWQEFKTFNYHQLASLMNQLVIIDGRNFLDRQQLVDAGFHYEGIGK